MTLKISRDHLSATLNNEIKTHQAIVKTLNGWTDIRTDDKVKMALTTDSASRSLLL